MVGGFESEARTPHTQENHRPHRVPTSQLAIATACCPTELTFGPVQPSVPRDARMFRSMVSMLRRHCCILGGNMLSHSRTARRGQGPNLAVGDEDDSLAACVTICTQSHQLGERDCSPPDLGMNLSDLLGSIVHVGNVHPFLRASFSLLF